MAQLPFWTKSSAVQPLKSKSVLSLNPRLHLGIQNQNLDNLGGLFTV